MFHRTTSQKATLSLVTFFLLTVTTSFVFASQNPAEMLSESFREAIHKVKPAVVSISAERKAQPVKNTERDFNMEDLPETFKRFFGEEFFRNFPRGNMNPRRDWQGSGVIISPEGEVLTNNHVVDSADKITVTLDDGRTAEADMDSILTDPGSDLALFKLKKNGDYPYAKLGDSDDLEVGDWVLAIGSPFGLDQTVTQGIVSAKGRTSSDVQIGGAEFFAKDYIQTSASINPGNSGGPLINLNGEVIGVNNAIQTAGNPGNLGIGFAIPSNMANRVIANLREFGEVRRGYIGVYLADLDEVDMGKFIKQEYGIDNGALIYSSRPDLPAVTKDSPGDKAGLEEGDVIILFNGNKVLNPGQLINMVIALPPDTEVDMTILRKGKRLNKTLTLAQRPKDVAKAILDSDKSFSSRYLGLSLRDLTPELAEKNGYKKDMEGVIVVGVQPGSSAAQVDIQVNDVITEVNMNGDPVTSTGEFEEFLTDTIEQMEKKGEKEHLILLHIFRSDRKYPDRWVAPTINLDDEPAMDKDEE